MSEAFPSACLDGILNNINHKGRITINFSQSIFMQLNVKSFALATALTMGIMYLACVLVVAVAPDFAMQLLGWLAHIVNVEKFAGDVALTASGVLIGLVEVVVYAFVASWILAELYNKFSRQA